MSALVSQSQSVGLWYISLGVSSLVCQVFESLSWFALLDVSGLGVCQSCGISLDVSVLMYLCWAVSLDVSDFTSALVSELLWVRIVSALSRPAGCSSLSVSALGKTVLLLKSRVCQHYCQVDCFVLWCVSFSLSAFLCQANCVRLYVVVLVC